MDLFFKVAAGYPGGFVAEVDGYNCFVLPQLDSGQLVYRWDIQEGGGWTHRGGATVVSRQSGITTTAEAAEAAISRWIESNAAGSEPNT